MPECRAKGWYPGGPSFRVSGSPLWKHHVARQIRDGDALGGESHGLGYALEQWRMAVLFWRQVDAGQQQRDGARGSFRMDSDPIRRSAPIFSRD